jgi:long-chain-fatty-acid--CoA ligase ACSBG
MDILPKLPSDESMEISGKGLEYILKNYDPEVPDRNFLWTSDFRVELPVRVKKTGLGSEKPYTVTEMWRRVMEIYANDNALNF